MFDRAFLNGWNRLEISPDGYLCGLRALRESLKHQYGHEVTEDELLQIHLSEEGQAGNRELGSELGFDNKNGFNVGQLATMVRIWGQQRGRTLRLGFRLRSGQSHFADVGAEDLDADMLCIWSSSLTGNTGEDTDCYNGICPGDHYH